MLASDEEGLLPPGSRARALADRSSGRTESHLSEPSGGYDVFLCAGVAQLFLLLGALVMPDEAD